LSNGGTVYLDLNIDKDKAVNEIIDQYDAASVPDGIVAERLDSAGYSLGLTIDKESVSLLESSAGNIDSVKTPCTDTSAYKTVLKAKRILSRAGVPNDGKRFMIASPEFMEIIMLDDKFIKQGDLAQELVTAGAVGKIGGFTVFESNNTMFENTSLVASKKTSTEFICGHPNWCHRIEEWSVPVAVKDLGNQYIGASAVQGRKVYGMAVSKPSTLFVKRIEA
ncbi:MAG: hypothetical protein RSA97_02285, partial [Oscillospiraceae bacterium]